MANDFLLSILIQAKDAASQTVKAVGEAVRSLGGEAAAATKGVGGLDTATAEASGSVSRLGLSVGCGPKRSTPGLMRRVRSSRS
ncbi:hypothetical protein [Desulfolutivibrio sulfodismutans]|uniref:hypothetical protein n=1 Tax=Desulfolutivibrio sulfodismutans TaxID=63561 RepID=UPI00159DC410|nr:hypothetical protein [Desulfolutivibrio sulfodismutans]QLA11519.1 hypothetical protein GD606_04125 [Desulfolutivibrio sulfodismutans DSM 3696]